MIWLTWRQVRAQTAAVYAAVAAAAILLAVTGQRLVELARVDPNIFDRLTRTDTRLFYGGVAVLGLAPAVLGAFWGAPLVARELEAGTHRLVWNQSVTRTRWLAVKLGLTTLAAAAAVAVFSLAVTWWSEPLDGAVSTTQGALPSRLTPVTFAMRGAVPVAYAVFAVVAGAAIGAVLRRSLPAMAVTLAAVALAQVAAPTWIRPHLVPPRSQTIAVGEETLDGIRLADKMTGPVTITVHTADRGDWLLSDETVDATGRHVAVPSWFSACLGPPPAPTATGPVEAPDPKACMARFTAEGYRQHVTYQPAGRFWTLQWVESALFLALSGLLAGFCFWWLRRRAA